MYHCTHTDMSVFTTDIFFVIGLYVIMLDGWSVTLL